MRQLEVRLKPWEARRLRQLRDHATKARVLKRAVCLLMSAARYGVMKALQRRPAFGGPLHLEQQQAIHRARRS